MNCPVEAGAKGVKGLVGVLPVAMWEVGKSLISPFLNLQSLDFASVSYWVNPARNQETAVWEHTQGGQPITLYKAQ